MYIIKIHNTETGQIVEREMNQQELAQVELDKINLQKEIVTAQETAAAKAFILDKLGITEEEAKLLLS